MRFPTHIAIDTSDGTVFYKGADGKLFNEITATEFTDERNAALKRPTYRVFGVHLERWRRNMKVMLGEDGEIIINPRHIVFMKTHQNKEKWYLRVVTVTGGNIMLPAEDEEAALRLAAILDA